MGIDFDPTFFYHEKAAKLTLSSPDEEIRRFWIRHGQACIRISRYFAEELGQSCVMNIWIPDGYKDILADRLGPRARFKDSLDQILSIPYDRSKVYVCLESKVFGIGLESYTFGSSEFCLNYAAKNGIISLMDNGHYHPTEVVSDKLQTITPEDFRVLAKDFKVTCIETYHDHHQGSHRGKNTIHIVDFENLKVVHMGDVDFFVEIYVKNPQLIIFGGGHVSQPVAKIGKMLGFHVTVMDDREDFVTSERFPDADRLIKGSYDKLSDKIPAYENAYYVIVTRGHLGDSACARQILRRPYTYLGMIGSKNKVKLTREKLLGEGFSEEQLNSIHAPIGLPIGGHMPAEIAVSIAAEIVQEKNRYDVSYIDGAVEDAVRKKENGIMITIISKSGSSPRGTGSKMFIDKDGNSYGSIGGGNVEFQALKYAPEAQHGEIRKYNLSNQGGANLGMICGGEVEVLYELL